MDADPGAKKPAPDEVASAASPPTLAEAAFLAELRDPYGFTRPHCSMSGETWGIGV